MSLFWRTCPGTRATNEPVAGQPPLTLPTEDSTPQGLSRHSRIWLPPAACTDMPQQARRPPLKASRPLPPYKPDLSVPFTVAILSSVG
jgi:hypothetical protein